MSGPQPHLHRGIYCAVSGGDLHVWHLHRTENEMAKGSDMTRVFGIIGRHLMQLQEVPKSAPFRHTRTEVAKNLKKIQLYSGAHELRRFYLRLR